MRASRLRERQEAEEAKKRTAAKERQERRAFRQVVEEIATALGETASGPQATIERSVEKLGIDGARALHAEVQAIEAAGGMMTADGARRRTPGGVYLFILKQRLTEAGQKDVLKYILTG